MNYGDLRQSFLANDETGLDWTTLSRSCLDMGCPSSNTVVLYRGLFV